MSSTVRKILLKDSVYVKASRKFAREHGLDKRRTYTLRLAYYDRSCMKRWSDVPARWTGHAATVGGSVVAVFVTKDESLIYAPLTLVVQKGK